MWHEVARNAVVWIVKKYFRLPSPVGWLIDSLFICADCAKGQEEEGEEPIQMSKQAVALPRL